MMVVMRVYSELKRLKIMRLLKMKNENNFVRMCFLCLVLVLFFEFIVICWNMMGNRR